MQPSDPNGKLRYGRAMAYRAHGELGKGFGRLGRSGRSQKHDGGFLYTAPGSSAAGRFAGVPGVPRGGHAYMGSGAPLTSGQIRCSSSCGMEGAKRSTDCAPTVELSCEEWDLVRRYLGDKPITVPPHCVKLTSKLPG